MQSTARESGGMTLAKSNGMLLASSCLWTIVHAAYPPLGSWQSNAWHTLAIALLMGPLWVFKRSFRARISQKLQGLALLLAIAPGMAATVILVKKMLRLLTSELEAPTFHLPWRFFDWGNVCLLLLSILITGRLHAQSERQARWVAACAAAVAVLCAGVLFHHAFASATATATINLWDDVLYCAHYLAINAWALSLLPAGEPLLALFMAHDLGSRVGRRLLWRGGACLMLVGALRVVLQQAGLVTTEEGTAFYGCTLFAFLLLKAHHHASTIRAEIDARRTTEIALAQAIASRDCALAQANKERNLMRSTLKGARDYAVIATDASGTITLFNEGAEALLGYKAWEVEGQISQLAFHDPVELAERARILGTPVDFNIFRVLPNQGLCDKREWSYLRKDGSRVPVSLSVTMVTDDHGRPEGYVGIARDLTVDKKLEADRDGFFAVGQELLCVADLEGRLRSVNPAFHRIFGYHPEELTGVKFLDHVHPEDIAATQSAVADIMSGLALHRFENRWRAKDRRYHYISWDCTLPNEDGLYYASGWDITQEKLAARDKERHLEFEQQLLGIVSHDLRNPIAAIALTTEALLCRKKLDTALTRPLQRIEHSAKRAERLIFDLLDFTQARLGSGLRVQMTPIDIEDIVGRCIEDTALGHQSRTLIFDRSGQTPTTLYADGDRIFQLLSNLITNALKYSPEDSAITTRLIFQQDQYVIEVHNEGEAIATNKIASLFEPLQRGSPLGHADHNIGLGLYIVKEIVKAHCGVIEVDSDHINGVTFRATLPTEPSLA